MPLVHETDYGTPRSKAQKTVTLTIDGQAVTVPEGTSIMRAAMEMGTQIPKLCATDMLDAFGSCRLCLVEIEGRAGTPASCTTPVAAGMAVRTQTDRLKRLRKGVMELYISDHPLDCLTCAANGDCELQDMAGAVGLRDVRYGYAGDKHPDPGKDCSNPYFSYDPSKCIVCSRCVRACEEVMPPIEYLPYFAWMRLNSDAVRAIASSQETLRQGSLIRSRIIGPRMRSRWVV